MPRSPASSPKARNLGAELRKVRDEAGMNQRDLAQKLDVARARLQRWENGSTVPKPAEVASYLTLLGVNGNERDRLVGLAEDVDESNWLTSDVSGVRTELTTLIECERTCTSTSHIAPMIIPGLLQTAEYVRAVMTGLAVDDVDRRVGIRLGRQEVLVRKNAPACSAYISEFALREPIGGSNAMARQLRHIVSMTEHPNIIVQVIPAGSQTFHPALTGAFELFRFPNASPIVHMEHCGSAAFVYGQKEVAVYERAERTLQHLAMSRPESAKLIAAIATEMERIGE